MTMHEASVEEAFCSAVDYHRGGKLQTAAQLYAGVLERQPDHAEACHNLGVLMAQVTPASASPQTAIHCFLRSLVFRPSFADALSNLGNVCHELGLLEGALRSYQRASCLQPDRGELRYNLGTALLLGRHYRQGWAEYAWRWGPQSSWPRRSEFSAPCWTGESLAGRTILLHAEQGMGDAIQFCRFAPMVAAQGGQVVLEVQRPLCRLLTTLPGVTRILAQGEAHPPHDFHCPLMLLGGIFCPDPEHIPAAPPYLTADARRAEVWRQHLAGPGMKIGICWQGNPKAAVEKGRSAPLACFAPLGRIPGARLISLQKQHGLDQLQGLPAGMRVETLGNDFDSGENAFLDTVAVMMNLDLVVTVDTVTAHLAGALDRPVWMALQKIPYWVWGIEGEKTSWYPRTRLFRQTDPGDWSPVFSRMAAEISSRP